MRTDRVLAIASIALGLLLAAGFLLFRVSEFANVKFLGGLLLLEILVVCVWRYEQRFFLLLIVAFVWAGIRVPLQATWTSGRWAVLATGAVTGFIIWMRKTRARFSAFHLVALVCCVSALVSATVSPFPRTAVLKALSLFLLFLYGSGGARAATFGREERLFNGLLWGCEIVVWVTAIAYFGLGSDFWGNPNSLGVAMSVGAFPILFWGWFTSKPGLVRWRRLLTLLGCSFLGFFSLERAGMVAIVALTLAFCFCVRQYKLLMKVALLALGAIGVIGMVKPAELSEFAVSVQDAILYKGGHREEGVLGSRWAPWEKTISNIKQNPWFGTGYGTSPTGEDVGFGSGTYSSSAETAREHGSSYMTILEWMGLLGVLPFVVLLGLNAFHLLRVGLWLRRAGHASHYSVPLGMVLFAGFIHATFEDWMFAPGSYFCVYFWTFAFILTDLLPPTGVADPVPRPVCGASSVERFQVEAVVPSR